MNRHSILTKYVISYIFIGVLPIMIIGVIFYYVNLSNMKTRIAQTQYATLVSSMNKIDSLLSEMSNVAYHLTNYALADDSTLKNFEVTSDLGDALISQQLKAYEQSFSQSVQVALYLRGDSNIYLNDGKYHYSVFEHTLDETNDLTMAQFFTMINTTTRVNSKKLYGNLPVYSEGEVISYVYPLPNLDAMPQASLIFLFNRQTVINILESYLGEYNYNVYIYNDTLQEIFSNRKITITDELYKALPSIKGTGTRDISSTNSLVSIMHAVSDNTSYRFVFVTDADTFYRETAVFRKFSIAIALLFILFAIAIAVSMAKRNYKPIKNLLTKILDDDNTSNQKITTNQANEIDMIQGHWDNMIEQNQQMSLLIELQLPLVQNSCLVSLLFGNQKNHDDILFSLQCANINLSRPFKFLIILIFQKNSYTSHLCAELLNAFSQLIYPTYRIYGIELTLEKRVAFIVNTSETESDGQDIRKIIAQNMLNKVSSVFKICVKAAIGSIRTALSDISISFVEASVVANDYLSRSSQDILVYDDVVKTEFGVYTFPVIEQAVFIQAIKQTDKNAAMNAIDKMIGKVSTTATSFLIMQCMCFDIINMILKVANQIQIEIKPIELSQISKITSIDEFQTNVKRLTNSICDQYQILKDNNHNRLRSDLIQFVTDNFRNSDFSLDLLSEKFEFSPSYLSRFFKQETGYSFIQYVTMLRMDYFKDALISADKPIKELVLDIGYLDIASFQRKFKSLVGMTPGQYRKQYRINQ